MSIAVLGQVYTEARRLAIAGSNLAVGDFRLKKLVDPLEKSAQKAPVFGVVAKAIDKLVSGNEKESAQSLLDLSSLVLAILYTQGQTTIEGKPQPIQSKELTLITTQMPARTLKPLIEALTSQGGGRQQVIQEGFESGAFADIRLVNPAVGALDDTYNEIADFVTDKILPNYGLAILPEIRDKIDIKGRAGNVRRLRLFHTLDPAGARPIVLQAFESGSKEMRIAALGCLGDSPEDLPHLLEQAESKSKEVRSVALGRLGKFEDDKCVAMLVKALAGADRELVLISIRENKSAVLWKSVLEVTQRELDEVLATKDKAKLVKQLARFQELLYCYLWRSDKACLAQLTAMHDRRAELLKLKATPVSGADVVETLCEAMLSTNDKALLQRLVDDREEMTGERFAYSAAAGLLVLPPKKFYEYYAPYFVAKPTKTKSARTEGPRETLCSLMPSDGQFHGRWYHSYHRFGQAVSKSGEDLAKRPWDPQWLEAAIAADEVEAAIRLGSAKHAGLKKLLLDHYASGIGKKEIDYELYTILKAIVDFGYPEATDKWLELLRKQAATKTRYYSTYFMAPLIAKLPKTSLPKIEAALTGMPDALVVEILPHLKA